MRKIFILLLILGSLPAAFAQKSNATPVTTRYYYFTGNIDKYPVTFQLYRVNNDFMGSYYYNSSEEAIHITGIIDKNGFLTLTHSNVEGLETESFSGNFKDSSFSGTWSYSGKLFPFRVSKPKDNNGLAFDYIYTSGSKKLSKEVNGRAELSYEASTIWPAPSSTHAATGFIKQLIYKLFGDKESKDEIGKVMISEKHEILNQVNKETEAVTYEFIRMIMVNYRNNKLLTISSSSYTDVGGAHGMYGTSYTCIDLVHNRKLAISDVLDTLACQAALQTLLAKKFRAVYHLKNEEKLSEHIFTETIPISNNFSLTSKGIAFNYSPYELGAYSLGEVFLYIPFKELSSCLKPEFKQLIAL